MRDIYEQHSDRLEDYVRSFDTADEQIGALVAIDGAVVGFDLFDSAETLRKLFPKLLRSYGLDALERATAARREAVAPEPPSLAAAEGFLRAAAEAEEKEFAALGEGQDVRLTAAGLTGAALASGDHLVHLCAFAVEDANARDNATG